MKLAGLSSLFALLLVFSAPGQAGNVLTLVPDASTYSVGDTLKLDVVLTAADSDIFGYEFDLNYPTFLNFVSANEEGDFAAFGINGPGGGPPIYDTPDDIDGIVAEVQDALSSAFTDSGAVVEFQFSVVAPGTGSFSLAEAILADDSADSLELDPVLSSASFEAQASPSTPEPSSAGLLILGTMFLCWRLRVRKGLRSRISEFLPSRIGSL